MSEKTGLLALILTHFSSLAPSVARDSEYGCLPGRVDESRIRLQRIFDQPCLITMSSQDRQSGREPLP